MEFGRRSRCERRFVSAVTYRIRSHGSSQTFGALARGKPGDAVVLELLRTVITEGIEALAVEASTSHSAGC